MAFLLARSNVYLGWVLGVSELYKLGNIGRCDTIVFRYVLKVIGSHSFSMTGGEGTEYWLL